MLNTPCKHTAGSAKYMNMATSATAMKLAYPPEIDAYVREQIAAGRFADETEFATAAFRMYRELEQRHQELRSQVQHSIEQAERGELAALDMEEIKAELAAEFEPSSQED